MEVSKINRRFEIAKFLLENLDFLSIEYLSDKFCVSVRTMRDDLEYIETFLKEKNIELLRVRKKGIKVNLKNITNEEKQVLLKDIKEGVYYSKNDRLNAVISYLLLNDSKFTISMLCDYFEVGKNTIIRDLEECEKWFNKQNIVFKKNKKAGTMLSYDEYSYRKAVLNYTSNFLNQADFQKLYQSFDEKVNLAFDMYANNFINHFTEDNNLLVIKNFIRKYENDFMINFSDESFMKIFFYLCISVTRIKQENCLEKIDYSDKYIDTDNIEWLNINKRILENGLGIRISPNEEIGILLTILSQNKFYLEDLEVFEYLDEAEIVKKFVSEVEKKLCVNILNDNELIQNLSMHMKPAINRMRYSINEVNPLKSQIMEMYPVIFDGCKQACVIYEKQFSVEFNDDEIAYMVMHIASSIERNKDNFQYFRNVIIVCSSGIGTSNMIKSRLLTEFPNIIIKGIYSVKDLHLVDKRNIDLIISTVVLYGKYEQPVVYVSPLLTGSDIEIIEQYIVKGSKIRRHYRDVLLDRIMLAVSTECNIENYSRLQNKLLKLLSDADKINAEVKSLSHFLKKETILITQEIFSWKDSINMTGEMLVEENSISKGYIKRIIAAVENETVSVVLGKGVAMPHVKYSEDDVYKTGFALLKTENPIKFPGSDEDINLIILLAADKNNSHIDAINEITNIMMDDDILKEIKSARSKTRLIEILKEYEMFM